MSKLLHKGRKWHAWQSTRVSELLILMTTFTEIAIRPGQT